MKHHIYPRETQEGKNPNKTFFLDILLFKITVHLALSLENRRGLKPYNLYALGSKSGEEILVQSEKTGKKIWNILKRGTRIYKYFPETPSG